MTSKCPLNAPKCKREIMTQRGPFKDERCPWLQKKKCAFSVSVCPMVSDRDAPGEVCMLNKINRIAQSGGCGAVRPSAVPPCASQQTARQSERYRQPCEKEAPPCVRCPVGGISNRPNKVTESIQQKETKELKEKPKNRKKEGAPTQPLTSSQELRSKIEDKLDDLKTREHLTQPPCSTASRRPLPCCACMLDILGPQSSKPTVCTSPKAYATLQKPPCPFMRIIDTCPKSCRCENVPPVDTGPPCPFLPLKCPCCSEPKCPLNRIATCPLIQNPPQPTPREGGQCSCCCPVVPGNCSVTLPGCVQHNTTGLLGNSFLPVSGLVPRDPYTGSPSPGITTQEPSQPLLSPSNQPVGSVPPCSCTQNALASLRIQGFDPVWQQQFEGILEGQMNFNKPAEKLVAVTQEGSKEMPAKKRPRGKLGDTSKGIIPGNLPDDSPEIKVKGGATLIKEGDGFKVFQKGNKKILINYKEKNCWLMGCSCGPKGAVDRKDSDENCGCNDWVASSIKKKKTATGKEKSPDKPSKTKVNQAPLSETEKSAMPANMPKQTTDTSKQDDLPESPDLTASKPPNSSSPTKQTGACPCVDTLHCGMDQFKQAQQQQQQQQETFNMTGASAWPKPLSTKTDAPLSSAPPSVVPSVFSMSAVPSYESSYYGSRPNVS